MKLIPLVLAVASVSSCGNQSHFGSTVKRDESLFPAEWKHPDILLSLAGIDIAASVKVEKKGDERTLSIIRDDTVLEKEVYKVDDSGISLKTFGPADGETYDPPLTLIKFPMTIGEPISWSGTYNVPGRSIPATAKVTSGVDQLQLPIGQIEALRTQVELVIDDGSKQSLKRTLTIWFAKDEGPIMRDFGKQVRSPRKSSEGGAKK